MRFIDKVRMFKEWAVDHFFGSWYRYKMSREAFTRLCEFRGQVISQGDQAKVAAQGRCNHRKGGRILRGNEISMEGLENGDDMQYAVIKHTFANGDVQVRCLRCGKKWNPDDEGYDVALHFPTRNVPSSAIRFTGPDAFFFDHRRLVMVS